MNVMLALDCTRALGRLLRVGAILAKVLTWLQFGRYRAVFDSCL